MSGRHRQVKRKIGRYDYLDETCARCGEPFGVHGAPPPHTRGDDCSGFRSANEHPANAGEEGR